MSIFAQNLSTLMEERGLSQSELARRLETSQSTVNRWINGTNPRKKQLRELAEVLSVRMEWLESGKGEKEAVPGIFALITDNSHPDDLLTIVKTLHAEILSAIENDRAPEGRALHLIRRVESALSTDPK